MKKVMHIVEAFGGGVFTFMVDLLNSIIEEYDVILVCSIRPQTPNNYVDYLDKSIKNLSGGEVQRIALIRSLLFKPEILLLDEITSSLDIDNTMIVENSMNILNKEGVTILWVTHDLDQSKRDSNKLLTIESGKIKSLEVLI